MKISYFPPVSVTQAIPGNGRNSIYGIKMHPNANPSWRGVYAQERYEYNAKWRWLPILLPIVICGQKAWMTERHEEMGHSIECIFRVEDCGETIDEAEWAEIASMLRPDNSYISMGLWHGVSPEELKARMVKRRGDAQRWASRYRKHIDGMYTKFLRLQL